MPTKPAKAIHFTKAAIQKLPVPIGKRTYVHDEKITGLALCLTPAGTRTWYLVRRVGRQVERIRLGKWPEMSIDQARTRAVRHNGRIADGHNPNDKRRTERGAPTLSEVFEEFVELPTRTKAKRSKSERTKHEYRLQFKAYLADWHDLKLPAIKRSDVEKLINHLAEHNGHYVANRVLALIRALFNTAIDLGYYNANPAARLSGFEEDSRERFLQPDELPKFWEALESEPSEKVRDAIKLLIFTGQRRSNVLSMQWADANLERGTWTLKKTKTGKHEVPLISPAVEILARRYVQRDEDSEYVFPGRHGYGHLKDIMRQWRDILTRAGIEDLRPHDLRRSLGSWQALTGSNLQLIGKTLGHKRPETTAIYSRLTSAAVKESMERATAAILLAAAKPAKAEEGGGDE